MSFSLMPAIVQASNRCRNLGDLTRFSTLTLGFFLHASLLIKECSDLEDTTGPKISYESFSQLSIYYKKTLSFIHISFQGMTKKRMQVEFLVSDLSENATFGFCETWLTPDHDVYLWNVASSTMKCLNVIDVQTMKKRRVAV